MAMPSVTVALERSRTTPPPRTLWLAGGSVMTLRLAAGDRLRIVDVEGMQPVQLYALDRAGRVCSHLLHLANAAAAHVTLSAHLDGDTPEQVALRARLDELGVQPADIQGVQLGAADNASGQTVELVADQSLLLCLATTCEGQVLDGHLPATELRLELQRVAVADEELPPPLADPKAEIHIAAGTATAYEVAAGDYIQVIDVAGRQCSDLLVFDAAALAVGEEHGLDPTATRTLTNSIYPLPGLHDKFVDDRMRPLLSVVRDTVGRHDTFALACTARYYEDLGYPGHPNCSDNFNVALAAYGITPRRGWPAINFFYNTALDGQGRLSLDEPWSRPGDYVLLRALTDLVCASSSCADDIDAANGWQPTDIHVRIYDAEMSFSPGIATRMTPDAQAKLTRETGFHARIAALTRNFVEYRGYWLPDCFSAEGPVAEYQACRERAAVMDLSPLRKFEVVGPDAQALLQATFTRDVSKLAVGRVSYGALCYEHGGMLDDGTVFRLTETNYRLVCGDEYCGTWLREQAVRLGLKAWVKSSTDQLHNIAVQGPRARDILIKVIWTPPARPNLAELGWFRFTVGRIGGPSGPAVLVSRTGYTGELGYEVWCHPADGAAVWDAVWTAGEPQGLAPLGLAALDMLRIEAGLAFSGYEFCDQTDPFEAGIGFCVPDKDADYVGKSALAERKAHPRRKLVGLVFEGNEAVGHGDGIYAGRAQVGEVTSATHSPRFGRWIALARVDATQAEIGNALEVGKLDGHQKRIPAQVVRFPHFDPDKTRVRA